MLSAINVSRSRFLSQDVKEQLNAYPDLMQAECIQTKKTAYIAAETACRQMLESEKVRGYNQNPYLVQLVASGQEVFNYCQQHKDDVNMRAHDYERYLKKVLENVRLGLDQPANPEHPILCAIS